MTKEENEGDDGGQYQAYLADRQTDAWLEFLMTGRPSALAAYLEYKGEVDDDIRNVLIEILRNGPHKNNKGGRDSWRDYTTYVTVKSIMLRGTGIKKACQEFVEITDPAPFADEGKWRALSTDEVKFLVSRRISKTAACRKFAEQTNQEPRTVAEQYKRGSKVFN